MRIPKLCVIWLLLAVALGLVGGQEVRPQAAAHQGFVHSNTGSLVVDLDGSSFDREVGSGTWMIAFSAGWCEICKQLHPVWEALAFELNDKGVKVGRVDADVNKALASRMNIRGYPTIFHIHDGQVRQHKGARSVKLLSDFAIEGYEEVKAIPWMASPFGPMGRSKGWMLRLGAYLHGLYIELVARGFPMWVIGFLAVFGGMSVTLAVVLVLSWIASKEKKD